MTKEGKRAASLLLTASIALTTFIFAQSAAIVRPSEISKDSHELQIEPILAGFRIGDSTDNAIKKLGRDLTVEKLGDAPDSPVSYSNKCSGISIIATHSEGIGIILVSSPYTGSLDSLNIGDTYDTVIKKWGPPAAGNRHDGLWLAGIYVLTASFDEKGCVSRLGIGLGMNVTT